MAFFKSSAWLTISDNYAVIKKHLRTFYGEVSESTAENIVPREPELGTINGTINGTIPPVTCRFIYVVPNARGIERFPKHVLSLEKKERQIGECGNLKHEKNSNGRLENLGKKSSAAC